MNLEYTDEQRMLRESVQRYIHDAYDFEARRTRLAEGFDPVVWAQFAELGWLAAPFSDDHGGLGGGAVERAIVMEGMGQCLALEPYLSTVVLAGTLIAEAGSPAQQAERLPSLMDGSARLALAYAEPWARYELACCETRAATDGPNHVLTGSKVVVFGARDAQTLIVAARTAGEVSDAEGITLFLVPSDAKGLSRTDFVTMDGRSASNLSLDQVVVEPAQMLGPLHGGLPLLELAIDHGTAAVASEAVGAMSVLLDLTLDYLKTRKQFGRPLSANQALQHRLVDMHIAVEESRVMALHAAHSLLQADPAARRKAVSAAKVCTGQAGRLVGQEAVQMHGAMGVTDECAASHYFKRLTMIELSFGNTDWHEQRYAAVRSL